MDIGVRQSESGAVPAKVSYDSKVLDGLPRVNCPLQPIGYRPNSVPSMPARIHILFNLRRRRSISKCKASGELELLQRYAMARNGRFDPENRVGPGTEVGGTGWRSEAN